MAVWYIRGHGHCKRSHDNLDTHTLRTRRHNAGGASVLAGFSKGVCVTEVTFRGRAVGHVDSDGVFWRRVHDRHVLRQPPAIALHEEVLAQLVDLDCKAVAFTMDDGRMLTGPLSLFHSRGIPVDRGGHGPQRAVLLADFLAVWMSRADAPAQLDW